MNEWEIAYHLVCNNQDDVVIYETTHHPYVLDGKPYGMLIEVAHNRTQDKWVKITPASGSHRELIDEATAKDLLKDGSKVIWERSKEL